MEHYKILNVIKRLKLLNDSAVWRFVTKKWIEVNDLSGGQYFVDKNIWFKALMLRSDLCGYSDGYIVIKGRINVADPDNIKNLDFKNNTPITSCVIKISKIFTVNTEDLDIVIMMYNLLEYNDNCSMTSGSL